MDLKEAKEKTIALALAVYRITEKIPEGEVLIGQMKGLANQVVIKISQIIYKEQKIDVISDIEALKSLFKIAQEQNWLNKDNFIVLAREYEKIINFLNKSKVNLKKKNEKHREQSFNGKMLMLSDRQKQILDFIKQQKNPVNLKQIREIFPKVTRRTLSRDLKILFQNKFIHQEGLKRGTRYFVP